MHKHPNISYALYGVATALKHLTILLLPIYICYLVCARSAFDAKSTVKRILVLVALFLAPIVIPSIPYFLNSPTHMINSIAFNVTREPETMFDDNKEVVGFNKMFVLYNQDNMSPFLLLLPRIPMIAMFLLLSIIYFKKVLSKWQYAMLAYVIFVSFNPTLFGQYFMWFFTFFCFGYASSSRSRTGAGAANLG
jgi:hypothetical protein